jgi:transcriptional regulator with XRE-family HTH domain
MAENKIQQEQGVRLGQLFDQLDLTQVAVSEYVKLSQSYISQMVTGDRPISKKILQFIANEYPAVSINWIMTGNGEPYFETKGTDHVSEKQFQYGETGVLERLIQQVQEMDARLRAIEKSLTKS